jgi:uncharacterized DUF497 family protein
MMIWDETKRSANLAKHGIDFAIAVDFDWDGAFVVEDDRFDYGETRLVAVGNIAGVAHTMVFTVRDGVRVISLRLANRQERKLLR